jgi:hypothetical protein
LFYVLLIHQASFIKWSREEIQGIVASLTSSIGAREENDILTVQAKCGERHSTPTPPPPPDVPVVLVYLTVKLHQISHFHFLTRLVRLEDCHTAQVSYRIQFVVKYGEIANALQLRSKSAETQHTKRLKALLVPVHLSLDVL